VEVEENTAPPYVTKGVGAHRDRNHCSAKDARRRRLLFAAGERVATTRELRALALYLERGSEIEQYGEDLFYVPSQDGSKMYRVQYGNGHEFCSCPDHNYHPERACKHILAVGLLFAKKRSRRRQAFIAAFAEA
jgi:hypothetical protein